jgi:hypothetical protein
MGRGDDTPLSLRVARNRNGLRALTIQESHGFSRVECQSGKSLPFRLKLPKGQLVPQHIKQNHEEASPQDDIEFNHEDAPYETIGAHAEVWFEFEKQLTPQAVGIRCQGEPCLYDHTRDAPTLVLFNDHQSITLAGY